MNKISVIGRVSQDVTVNTVNGRNVANFNVASQNKNKTGEENGRPVYGTNFYRVSAWGPAADTAAKLISWDYSQPRISQIKRISDLIFIKFL